MKVLLALLLLQALGSEVVVSQKLTTATTTKKITATTTKKITATTTKLTTATTTKKTTTTTKITTKSPTTSSTSLVHVLTSYDLLKLDKILDFLEGPMIPAAERLGFHSCIGGCNGCINLEQSDNKILVPLVEALNKAYSHNNLSSVLSRADFWAYASIFAVNQQVLLANDKACTTPGCRLHPSKGFRFQWGRKDCATSPYTKATVKFPSAIVNSSVTFEYFERNFGMKAAQTVAVMGGCHKSHRRKRPIEEQLVLNNEFFQQLVDSSNDWRQRYVATASDPDKPIWQWSSKTEESLMLDTDMGLLKDLKLDANGFSSCTYSTCRDASTAELVQRYAKSNDLLMTDFEDALTKMLANGYNSTALQYVVLPTTLRPRRP